MSSRTAPDEDLPAVDSPRSWPLLLTSACMILAVFGLANPAFGVLESAWPWEGFLGGDATPRVTAVVGLWLVTALWVLLFSFAGPPRLRALGAVALGTLLVIECSLGGSPVSVSTLRLGTLVALITLGAGLWLARDSGHVGTRSLAGIGAFLGIWIAAATFETGAAGQSLLAAYGTQMETLFQDLNGTWALPDYLWDTLLPQTLILFAAAFGLLVSFGTRMPRTSTVVFFLLLAALLVPGVVEAFAEQRSAADAPEQASVSMGVFERLLTQLFERGVLLWMLGAFALADLVRSLCRADDPGEVDA